MVKVMRTWTATDDCNNSSTAVQIVFIVDSEAPIISGVGPDMTIDCNDVNEDFFSDPTATDNCDDDVLLTFEDFHEVICAGYNVTRVWTAIDDCGNSSNKQSNSG